LGDDCESLTANKAWASIKWTLVWFWSSSLFWTLGSDFGYPGCFFLQEFDGLWDW
jgi:hypothetical protein